MLIAGCVCQVVNWEIRSICTKFTWISTSRFGAYGNIPQNIKTCVAVFFLLLESSLFFGDGSRENV